jgi:tRNA-splicing ligase RtcB
LSLGLLDQVANVATLSGIVKYSMAMPDAHLGYGFPIGGVAAFREDTGVISPGGVGFDINCGVRLLRSDLQSSEVQPLISTLIDNLFEAVPSGLGSTGRLHASDQQLTEAFLYGAKWAVDEGYGVKDDLAHCEENGSMKGADPSQVSVKARKRGRPQLGTIGSGNHFLEIQRVEEIFDEEKAKRFGLFKGQITIMIHCGSRGAGHQICTDHLEVLSRAVHKYCIEIPDKQLACAPIGTPEANNYFGAMVCAANYAWANRHIIAHWTREVFDKYFGNPKLDLIYDVAHNVAKIEEHNVDGQKMRLYVHRKGATRAFGPSRPEVPEVYSNVGQPVLIPGSMGTPSYVLCGADKALDLTFGSACHARRIMSGARPSKPLPAGTSKPH